MSTIITTLRAHLGDTHGYLYGDRNTSNLPESDNASEVLRYSAMRTLLAVRDRYRAGDTIETIAADYDWLPEDVVELLDGLI